MSAEEVVARYAPIVARAQAATAEDIDRWRMIARESYSRSGDDPSEVDTWSAATLLGFLTSFDGYR